MPNTHYLSLVVPPTWYTRRELEEAFALAAWIRRGDFVFVAKPEAHAGDWPIAPGSLLE